MKRAKPRFMQIYLSPSSAMAIRRDKRRFGRGPGGSSRARPIPPHESRES
jgi:hypothetical protein